MNTKLVFVDSNVLVYRFRLQSPFHRAATFRMNELRGTGYRFCISSQSVRECLAAMTRLGPESIPVSPQHAAAFGSRLLKDFTHLTDDFGTSEKLLELTAAYSVIGRQVHDACIVATMLTHGVSRLLTHNTGDFARYSQLIEVLALNDQPKI